MEDITHLARIAVIDDEKPKQWSPWGECLSELNLKAVEPPLPELEQAWDKVRLDFLFEHPSVLRKKRPLELKYLAGFLVDGISPRHDSEKKDMIFKTIKGLSNNLGAYLKNNDAICESVGLSLVVLTELGLSSWEDEYVSSIKNTIEIGSGIRVEETFMPVTGEQESTKRRFEYNKKIVLREIINRYKSNNDQKI